ncbi:MAG: DUF805 domain-containing protein [Candidatus Edwardsbacteria bacterium]|jgi:uncharacterized membrane protein YhaH (DUF805 family)|nr:DUF805 domain-containing protein [Candidatus Edwardsbacteria bacterium]
MDVYIAVLRKYAVFEGRAGRREYWTFFLINIVAGFALGFVEGLIGFDRTSGSSVLGNLYTLAVLVPSIAVGVRRMHDVGKSGWYLLVPIYNLILACTAGEEGDNQYGPVPGATE